MPDFKHAAVIHNKGKIIAVGRNYPTYSSHPRYPTTHAEIDAISKALRRRKNLNGLSIFVLRITPGGMIKKSKPCGHCMQIILAHSLKPSWTE